MPIFLDTRGHSTLGIGICGRCSRKFPLDELMSDPNYPGLRCCKEDIDDFDPYRLPARQTEDVALRFCRPDRPLDGFAVTAEDTTYGRVTAREDPRVTADGDQRVTE